MAKSRRKAMYPATLRFARIALELGSRPCGWSFESIEKEIDNIGAHAASIRRGVPHSAARRRRHCISGKPSEVCGNNR